MRTRQRLNRRLSSSWQNNREESRSVFKLWLFGLAEGLQLKCKSVWLCPMLHIFWLFHKAEMKKEGRGFTKLTLWGGFEVITCLHLPWVQHQGEPRTSGVTGESFDHKSEVAVRSKSICQEVESPDWDGLGGIVWNVSCSLEVSLPHFHALFVLRYVMFVILTVLSFYLLHSVSV